MFSSCLLILIFLLVVVAVFFISIIFIRFFTSLYFSFFFFWRIQNIKYIYSSFPSINGTVDCSLYCIIHTMFGVVRHFRAKWKRISATFISCYFFFVVVHVIRSSSSLLSLRIQSATPKITIIIISRKMEKPKEKKRRKNSAENPVNKFLCEFLCFFFLISFHRWKWYLI